MSLFTLNTEETKVIASFSLAKNRYESSSKDLFVLGFKLYKQYKDNKTNEITKVLNLQVSDMIENSSTRLRARKIFKLADSYTRLKPISKFSMLHMYNLEAMIKLLEYIEDNEDKCVVKLDLAKEMIKKVFIEGMGKITYNNKLLAVLKDIKSGNGIQDVEGEYIIVDFSKKIKNSNTNTLESMLDDLTKELASRQAIEEAA